MGKQVSVLMFGRKPPPIGGVTQSVANTQKAIQSLGLVCEMLSWRALCRRWNVAHIHFSKPWYRFLGVVLARLVAQRAFVTVHGRRFDARHPANRIAAHLADGFVLLNHSLDNEIRKAFPDLRTLVSTSIFAEGIDTNFRPSPLFERDPNRCHVLLYVYNDFQIDGRAVYGQDFVLDNWDQLSLEYRLVLLNLNANIPRNRLPPDAVYLEGPCSFLNLLSQIDIYLRPTLSDGAAVSIFEALSMGVPVVASDAVDRHGDVILFKTNDVDDLKKALEKAKTHRPAYAGIDSVKKLIRFYFENRDCNLEIAAAPEDRVSE